MNVPGLAKALRELAKVPAKIAKEVSGEITDKLQAQFASGSDPYGATWAALKSGGPSHLIKSNTMAPGVKASPMAGAGIKLEAPSPANFHQSGTRTPMPARPILPAKGLPADWRAILQAKYTELMVLK